MKGAVAPGRVGRSLDAPRVAVPPDVIALWGLTLAVVLALAAAAAQLIDFGVYGLRIHLLDMSTHASVFGVISVLALIAAGAAAIELAANRRTCTRWSCVLPLLLAVLLALRVIHPAHVLVLALPFAVATFAALWWHVGAPGSRARRLVRVGCVVLIGSYAVHAVGTTVVSALGYGAATWPYQVKLVIKHSGELAGWAIVATGLVLAHIALVSARAGEPAQAHPRQPLPARRPA